MKLTKTTLDQLGFVGRGRSRHRPRNDQSLFGGKYPFIQTGEVKAANLYINDFKETYNDKGLAQSKLWEENTLLITIAANIADTAILKIRACFPDSIVAFIPKERVSDVKYVKYYLDFIQIELKAISQGTTQDNMSLDKLLSKPIYVHSFEEQKKIASILSAYDDLIENNNQRITLLEDMAAEIYKEWFVRFRFPNYQNTNFLDKEGNEVAHGTKGGIPEGWEKKAVKDIVGNFKDKYKEEEHSHLGIFDLSRMPRKSLVVPQFGDSNELESSRIIFKENDILFGSIRSYFHKVSSANKKGITNVSVLIFRPKKEIYRSYSLFTFFSNHFINWSVNFSNGTKMPTISWNEVQNYSIYKPSDDLLEYFEELVFPMIKEIHTLSDKNIVLQETRDLLLPRLISGKLSVEGLEVGEIDMNMAAEPGTVYETKK
ncbi:restriction endonuclease subunit S [Dokdonia sp. Hel_I_53]|uniref:restriction endonuclease subunit S n=1 Tax=Dokdonia sp. Hel_I_53 TaxID=1566287 RepID=UPI00119B64D2|nr:restriction endonuclease subunit S [Dokdonia sp. Hel_I_53]TVZ51523.1 type I restriction enzyme S subunit [Dokdonia sp. Hel_I_53]